MRPRRAPTRGAPTVIGNWKLLRSPPPPASLHDPARNWAGIVHQRRPPRCRCPTTRRGDPCGRPPPNGATVRPPLPGQYRTGGVERRLSSRRLGSASFRAPGMATWSDDSAGERCDAAGHPQGVPLRSSGIGSFKEVPHRRAAGMIRPETGRRWCRRRRLSALRSDERPGPDRTGCRGTMRRRRAPAVPLRSSRR